MPIAAVVGLGQVGFTVAVVIGIRGRDPPRDAVPGIGRVPAVVAVRGVVDPEDAAVVFYRRIGAAVAVIVAGRGRGGAFAGGVEGGVQEAEAVGRVIEIPITG